MPKEYSIDSILLKAQQCLDQCQPDLALKFFEKALLQQPKNTFLLDTIGELCMELHRPERATTVFQESAKLAPDEGHEKWLYLGQLNNAEESEKCYQQGIRNMMKQLEMYQNELNKEQENIIRRPLSSAYCSLAELYMTDLCFHDNAENICQSHLDEALKWDSTSPEPLQALANMRLVQNRMNEAKTSLLEMHRRLMQCDEESQPSLEFRILSGKMLIQVQLFEEAADVLEGVMQEDDENAELWYLVGLCYKELGEYSDAVEFLETCLTMLNKLKKEMGDEFELDQQMEEVKTVLSSAIKLNQEEDAMGQDVVVMKDDDDETLRRDNDAMEE